MAIRNLFPKPDMHSIPVFGNFFQLTFVENRGAVFGIDPQFGNLTNILLLILHIIAIVIIIYFFIKNKNPLARFSFTLILSGAFGNLTDRIFFGKVTDFLDVDFLNLTIGKWQIDRWYVFNIADSCIVVGVILLIIYYLFVENSAKEKEILEKE